MARPESGVGVGGFGAASLLFPLLFAGSAALAGSTSDCYLRGDRLVSPCWEIRGDVFFNALLACLTGIAAIWFILRAARFHFPFGTVWTKMSEGLIPLSAAILLNLLSHLLRLPPVVPALIWLLALSGSVFLVYNSFAPGSRKARGVVTALFLFMGLAIDETFNGTLPGFLGLLREKRPDALVSKAIESLDQVGNRIEYRFKNLVPHEMWKYTFLLPTPHLLVLRPSHLFILEVEDTEHQDMPSPVFPTHVRLHSDRLPDGFRVQSVEYEIGGRRSIADKEDEFWRQLNLVKLRFNETAPAPAEDLRVRSVALTDADGHLQTRPVHLRARVVYHRPIAQDNAIAGVLEAVQEEIDTNHKVESKVWEREIELGNQLLFGFFEAGGQPPDASRLKAWVRRHAAIVARCRAGLWDEETRFEPYGRKTFILRFTNLPSIAYVMLAEAYLNIRKRNASAALSETLDVYRLARVYGSANRTLVHWIEYMIVTKYANLALSHFLAHNLLGPSAIHNAFGKLAQLDHTGPFHKTAQHAMAASEKGERNVRIQSMWEGSWATPLFPVSYAMRTAFMTRLPWQELDREERRGRTGYELNKAYMLVLQFNTVYGRFPDSLSEAAEALGLNLPIDAFAGAPVRYGKMRTGFEVTSFGADRDDDQGLRSCSLSERSKSPIPDCDWVLRYSEPPAALAH